jgi:tetratricopeptide (TPR) repeat protein
VTENSKAGHDPFSSGLRWPLAFVSLLLPFAIFPLALDPFQLPKQALVDLGTVAVLGIWLGGVLRSSRVRLRGAGAALPLLFFLFIALLSVFQAPSKAEALSSARDAAYAVLVFFLAASTLDPEDRLIPRCLGLAALSTAVLGLSQILLGPSYAWLPSNMGGVLVGDVSTAALFVALVFPVALILVEKETGAARWIGALGSGAMAAYVILARVRGAWAALAMGSLVYLTFKLLLRSKMTAGPARRPALAVVATVIATAGALIAWGVLGTGLVITSAPSSFKTSELQGWKLGSDTWRVTGGLALSHPLGVGAGNWREAFASVAGNTKPPTGFTASRIPGQAGNEYLQTAAELGAVGAVLLLWAGFALLRGGWSRARRGSALAVAGVSGLAGLAASAVLANPLREQPTLWTAVLLAAFAAAPLELAFPGAERALDWTFEPRRRKALGAAASVVFLLLAGLTVLRVSRLLLASADLKVGQAACARGDFDRGLPALLRAGRADASSAQAHTLAASCALQAGRTELAEKEARTLLSLNGQNVSAWFMLANVLKEKGNLIDAIAACEKAKQIFPHDEKINILLGDLRKLTGDTIRASQAYADAIAGNESSVQAFLRTGDNLMARGQLFTAVTAYARAVNLDPFSAEAMGKLGGAHMKAGDYDTAVSIYQNLLTLAPDDPTSYLSLAGALAGLLRHCEAVPLMQKAKELETNPARAEALTRFIDETAAKCKSQKAPAAAR